jgi:hypothetical protein
MSSFFTLSRFVYHGHVLLPLRTEIGDHLAVFFVYSGFWKRS